MLTFSISILLALICIVALTLALKEAKPAFACISRKQYVARAGPHHRGRRWQ